MQSNADDELLQRCVESIRGMGNSPTIVVDAGDFADDAISRVGAQLERKGWLVEVLPADEDEPAQLIISSPPASKQIPPEQPPRVPAADPQPRTFAQSMADDNLRKWTELERARQSGSSGASAVTFTASKATMMWAMMAAVALAAFAAAWIFYISPRRQLDQLAKDTCDELDGSIMLVAGVTLESAVNKAERLGFSGPELGDRMREHCPSILRQIAEFASSY